MVESTSLKERHLEDINAISQSWPDTARILSEMMVAMDSFAQKQDEMVLLFTQLIREKEIEETVMNSANEPETEETETNDANEPENEEAVVDAICSKNLNSKNVSNANLVSEEPATLEAKEDDALVAENSDDEEYDKPGGMDVSLGSPGQSDISSIAAVVSSRQWPTISRYRACVRTQSPKMEMIDSLFQQVSDAGVNGFIRELLIDFYGSYGKRRPDQIIIFRDCVSENRFNQVVNIELNWNVPYYDFIFSELLSRLYTDGAIFSQESMKNRDRVWHIPWVPDSFSPIIIDKVGAKALEHLSILLPIWLTFLKDDNMIISKQSIITGTKFFSRILEELSIQFQQRDIVERWLEQLWTLMIKFSDVVLCIFFEAGAIGQRLSVMKFLETCVLHFSLNPNDSGRCPREIMARQGKGFNLSWISDGHPILNPASLASDANRYLGILLDILRTSSNFTGPLTMSAINSVAAIARKRHVYYKSVLNALLEFDPKFEMIKASHTPSIQYSLRTAFLGFLRCTHPVVVESKERLLKVLRALNAGGKFLVTSFPKFYTSESSFLTISLTFNSHLNISHSLVTEDWKLKLMSLHVSIIWDPGGADSNMIVHTFLEFCY